MQSISLIQTREKILARILGFSSDYTLNEVPQRESSVNGLSLVSELKETINQFKAMAFDQHGGNVDYAELAKSNFYQVFTTELTPQLSSFDPATLATNAERLAFWINLYNVMVMDGVIRLEVKNSVTEGFIGILRFFRQVTYNIGGYRTSLEDIEHGILRGNRGNPFIPSSQFEGSDPRQAWIVHPIDPRIHFGLNCASKSCPPIGVYNSEQIANQLDAAAYNFISQEVSFETKTNTLRLSPIFKWFAIDFGGKKGVIDYVTRYLPENTRQPLITKKHKLHLKYTPYNWALNSYIKS